MSKVGRNRPLPNVIEIVCHQVLWLLLQRKLVVQRECSQNGLLVMPERIREADDFSSMNPCETVTICVLFDYYSFLLEQEIVIRNAA
jgi:hypothetical protein